MPRNISLEVPTPENLEFLRQRAQAERDMLDAAQNKNIASRVTPYVEAALATVAPMFTAPAAAMYGMGRTLATPFMGPVQREKAGNDFVYATPQDQAAADFMRLATFMPRTQKGQEYTQNVAELFEASKLPHAWPVSGNPPRLGPGAARYAGQALDLPGYTQTAPVGAIDLSKRKLFTLPKVEEKPAQVPAVIPEQQGALPVADPGRREFLKRGASNVVTGAMLDATPIGVLTKLAAEPVAKAVAEAPVAQVAEAALPDISSAIATYLSQIMKNRKIANMLAEEADFAPIEKGERTSRIFSDAFRSLDSLDWLDTESYEKLLNKIGLTEEQLAAKLNTTPEHVKSMLEPDSYLTDHVGGIGQLDEMIDYQMLTDGRPKDAYRTSELITLIEDSNAVRNAIKQALKEHGKDADSFDVLTTTHDLLFNDFKARQLKAMGLDTKNLVTQELYKNVIGDDRLRKFFNFALEPVEDWLNERVLDAAEGRKFRKIKLDKDDED